MRKCKDCKAWKSFIPHKEPKFSGMDHYNFKGDYAIGVCKHPKIEASEYPTESDRLSYIDSEQYNCWFYTAENFGCIHWNKY